jgi:FtsH-binding integral membrane protein
LQPYQNRTSAWGQTVTRSQAEVDQGLRAFMLGVYNNMVVGLAISALVALGVNMLAVADSPAETVARVAGVNLTSFGRTLYTTPLMWVFALAPLAFIFFFSFRMDRMSAATARITFFAFAAAMGVSLSTLLIRYTGASVVQVFFITGRCLRRAEPLRLHDEEEPVGHRLVPGHGPDRPHARLAGQHLPGLERAAIRDLARRRADLRGLTAYDTQKLKEMYFYGNVDGEAPRRSRSSAP